MLTPPFNFRNPVVRHLTTIALFAALTLLAFHPLSWQLSDKTTGGNVDKHIFLWDLWWVQFSLLELHQMPLHTDYLFYPTGCSLAYHTLNISNGVLGMLLGSTGNILLAHNILLLLSFFLSGYFSYLLVREMSGSYVGALLGGIIFAFAPTKWTAVFHGQMNISSTQWMPLFLFFLVKMLKTGRWHWALGMSLSLAAVFYTSYQQCVFLLLLILLVIPFIAFRERKLIAVHLRPIARSTAIFLVVSLVLMLPLATEMAAHYHEAMLGVPLSHTEHLNIQFKRLIFGQKFTHGWIETIPWGPARGLVSSLDGIIPRHGPMYGYCVSCLLVMGWLLIPFRKENRGSIIYWTLSTVPLIWLMMGTNPEIAGFNIPPIVPLFWNLPGFNAVRAVYRYAVPLTLAVAILVGYLLRTSRAGSHGRAGPRDAFVDSRLGGAFRFIIISMLVAVPYLEYLKMPLRVSDLPAPPAIYLDQGLGGEPGGAGEGQTSILELPFWCSGADFWIGQGRYESLYFQSFHRRKIVGGHHSRLAREMVPDQVFNKTLGYLSAVDIAGRDMPSPDRIKRTFKRNGIRYVNISRLLYRPEDETALVEMLEDVLDAQLLYEDSKFLTYGIPGCATGADVDSPQLVDYDLQKG